MKLSQLLVLSVMSLSLAACGGDDDDNKDKPNNPPQNQGDKPNKDNHGKNNHGQDEYKSGNIVVPEGKIAINGDAQVKPGEKIDITKLKDGSAVLLKAKAEDKNFTSRFTIYKTDAATMVFKTMVVKNEEGSYLNDAILAKVTSAENFDALTKEKAVIEYEGDAYGNPTTSQGDLQKGKLSYKVNFETKKGEGSITGIKQVGFSAYVDGKPADESKTGGIIKNVEEIILKPVDIKSGVKDNIETGGLAGEYVGANDGDVAYKIGGKEQAAEATKYSVFLGGEKAENIVGQIAIPSAYSKGKPFFKNVGFVGSKKK